MSGWQDGTGYNAICRSSLCLVPGSYVEVEEENFLFEVVSWLPHVCNLVHAMAHVPTQHTLIINKRALEMAQWVKALVTKTGDLTLAPGHV